MSYLVVVANGDMVIRSRITEVNRVVVEDGVYILYDKNEIVLFSAPTNSLVYLEME